MNAVEKAAVENKVLELQNDGSAYKRYEPVLKAICDRYYAVTMDGYPSGTMGYIIEFLKGGNATSFINADEYRTLLACGVRISGFGRALYVVLGRLLEDYYREYKYQKDRESQDNWAPTADDLAMEDAIDYAKKAVENANATIAKNNVILSQNKATTMTIKIENKLFYNGVDIKSYTDDQLFSEIAKAEAEVERLEKIATKPKKLQAKIDELKEGIKALADAIDAR